MPNMNHSSDSGNNQRSCKSAHQTLVQIGEPPAYWKSIEELRSGLLQATAGLVVG